MLDSTRVFVAIAIPAPLEGKLAQLQAELAPKVPGCRWTSALPFHLTLAFLGDVPDREVSAICQTVASSAGPIEPFEIEVTGLGAFPSTIRPRVIWAGVNDSSLAPLHDLQESVVNSLAKIGHRPDDQRFNPHVTIGIIKHQRRRPRDLTGLVERNRAWSAGQFTPADIRVFASNPGPAGSVYTVLDRCPLTCKKTEGPP